MRRDRFKVFQFDAISDYLVHVEFTSDLAKAIKKYPATSGSDPDSDTLAITIHIGQQKQSFIFFQHNANVATIVHEAWHVIYRMFNYFDIGLDDEAVAYHLDYLVGKIVEFKRRSR